MQNRWMRIFDWTMLKFLMVGVANTIVGCGTMFLLYNLANCSYWFSSAANYAVGGIFSFVLNKYFTFRKKEWSWGQVWRFALNVLLCWLAAYGAAKPLVMHLFVQQSTRLQENAAMLTGMCLYTILNYFGQRFFAFSK